MKLWSPFPLLEWILFTNPQTIQIYPSFNIFLKPLPFSSYWRYISVNVWRFFYKKPCAITFWRWLLLFVSISTKAKTNVKRMSVIKTLWISLKNRKNLENKIKLPSCWFGKATFRSLPYPSNDICLDKHHMI